MSPHTAIFLFFAGALGGGINAVAGGGSFVSFPALLFVGVPPIPANATNTLALWVGTTASGGAYPQKLNIPQRVMIPLVLTSILGGLAGAFLLIKTPAQTFLHVLPWLMLGATLLFAFGKHLTGRISAGISHDATTAAVIGASVFELLVAVYGGYFGAGIGILMLSSLSFMGIRDIHEMNALKSILGTCINGVAVVVFVVEGKVNWHYAVVMAVAAILGGFLGAHYARRLNPNIVRWLVIVIGFALAGHFFYRQWINGST